MIKLNIKPKAATETASGIKLGVKPQVVEEAEVEEAPAPAPAVKLAPKPAPSSPAPKTLAFIKKGAAAQEEMKKEEIRAEQKSKANVRRFWLKPGGETKITFLDGDIVDGWFGKTAFFHQHSVFMNGNYNNHFICTEANNEPCPICEGGDQAAQVGVFTIINHSKYENKGKVYQDQIELLVAKRNTVQMLVKKAIKQGGLTGCTFDVRRGTDKDAAVGNDYDFDGKRTLKELAAAYGAKDKIIQPFNYEQLLGAMYLSAVDLRRLGFGNQAAPIGSEQAVSENYAGL